MWTLGSGDFEDGMKPSQPPANPPPSGPQGTMIFRPGDLPAAAPEDVWAGADPADSPRLIGVGGGFDGRAFPLRPGKTLIGRRSSSDIVLDTPGVSALHAWIVEDRGQFRIINALSTNGTFVDGIKVHDTPLADGALLRLGDVELRFRAGRRARQRHLFRQPLVWALSGLVLAAVLSWALWLR